MGKKCKNDLALGSGCHRRLQSDTGQGCGLLGSLPSAWRLLFQSGSVMADKLTDELSVRPQFFPMWLPEQPQDILGAFLRVIHPREQSRSFHTFSVSSWKSPIISSAMLLVSQTSPDSVWKDNTSVNTRRRGSLAAILEAGSHRYHRLLSRDWELLHPHLDNQVSFLPHLLICKKEGIRMVDDFYFSPWALPYSLHLPQGACSCLEMREKREKI